MPGEIQSDATRGSSLFPCMIPPEKRSDKSKHFIIQVKLVMLCCSTFYFGLFKCL